MPTSYRIGPAIGIARVGDSPEYYLAPTEAGGLPVMADGSPFTAGDFRDGERRLRRQAAQFTVFATPEGGRTTAVVPGKDGVAGLEWTVHLANKKAIWYEFATLNGEDGYASNHPLRNAGITGITERTDMIIDPGPRTLTGAGQSAQFSRTSDAGGYPMTFPPPGLEPYGIDTLGEVHTDSCGRLTVAGGFGRSGSMYSPAGISSYVNNPGWWDDTSDGPVTATVVLDDGTRVRAEPAWVICGPPAYAPQILNLVTLYDTMFDVAVRALGARPDLYSGSLWNDAYTPDFDSEILPVLMRGHHYPSVVAIPPKAHEFDVERLGDPDPRYNALRQYYFGTLRAPDQQNTITSPTTGYTLMPYLAGDDATSSSQKSSKYLTLTDTQYFLLQQWAAGQFRRGSGEGRQLAAREADLDPCDQLTRATLENCVGGAFSPGIEMTWICRNPLIYTTPFRLKPKKALPTPLSLGADLAEGLEPGDLIKYMAQPWQADFNVCSSQPLDGRVVWWWPAQRPLMVYTERGRRHQVPWVGSDDDQNAPDYLTFKDYLEMVHLWHRLGFVYNLGTQDEPEFVEVERTLPRVQ
jgi:L-Lysine epsilon oxidase N-terminal/L-lysine epsilon oxidase C-terminal domain